MNEALRRVASIGQFSLALLRETINSLSCKTSSKPFRQYPFCTFGLHLFHAWLTLILISRFQFILILNF
jgi:hypothetical protein